MAPPGNARRDPRSARGSFLRALHNGNVAAPPLPRGIHRPPVSARRSESEHRGRASTEHVLTELLDGKLARAVEAVRARGVPIRSQLVNCRGLASRRRRHPDKLVHQAGP